MESDKHELLRPRTIMRDTAKGVLFPDRHTEKANFDPSLRACDGLFALPVDEKGSRSGSQLGHVEGLGMCLRWPFPPA